MFDWGKEKTNGESSKAEDSFSVHDSEDEDDEDEVFVDALENDPEFQKLDEELRNISTPELKVRPAAANLGCNSLPVLTWQSDRAKEQRQRAVQGKPARYGGGH